ncbi:ubiquinone biosynthesis monooxygenase COQ6, mitochondrial-like [Vigna unguiculata]|uniref:ubiquinone biosynthesis monooxygenase COQ6, mitochondrial-like n=1 Tax=Vigna unguiculata TaxID=3917 RepID=UPI001015DD07|nr:ubiquinone biosynthesis monooxygenase COQ6, mitochondrial-like [Vigna unguiculata]
MAAPSPSTSRDTSKRATCEPVRAFAREEERCIVSQQCVITMSHQCVITVRHLIGSAVVVIHVPAPLPWSEIQFRKYQTLLPSSCIPPFPSSHNENRVMKKTISNVCALKIPRKYFSTEGVKVGGSAIGEASNEHEKKQTISKIIPQYDIAIVGRGMVGMALACFLASMPMTKQLNVAIVDSNPALSSGLHMKKEDPPDPRVSTVTPASISSLRGCVAENKVLHNALLSCVKDSDFKTTIYPLRLSSMTLNTSSMSVVEENTKSVEPPSAQGHGAKLQLSDGSSLYAKLVVGADGGKSHVRELAGIKTTGWNYSQNAIICTVEHASENVCAWQRFLPTGPIALLPIGDKFSNIVWTMSPAESNSRKSITEEEFLKDVNYALDYGYGPRPTSGLLGTRDMFSWFKMDATISTNEFFEIPPKVIKLASERMVFPLTLRHANSYASKRVVLIGDAAHTVHPLAGQGVNLGFGDAFSLSRIIAEGIVLGTDIGEVNLLKKYETERRSANIMMMTILDGFQKAYSVDFGPFNILRAAAFHGANYISPLKKGIISYASGEHKLPIFL